MSKFVDLSNQVFGDLTVIKRAEDRYGRTRWLCRCSCGKYVERYAYDLKYGNTTSCGCKKYEKISKKEKLHGMSKTKFYKKFYGMKSRCYNPNNKRYKNYGGRGIKVEWNSFEEFKNDMYDSYLQHIKKYGEKNTTIDRIDVNGNYCKENCRWATIKEQNQNTTRNIVIKYKDKEYTVNELSKIIHISSKCIYERLSLGWSIEKIIKKNKKEKSNNYDVLITYRSETHNLSEWSEITGIPVGTLSYRYNKNFSVENIFKKKKKINKITKELLSYDDYKNEIISISTRKNFNNLIGQKFGALTVVARLTNKKGKIRWLCRCDCGNYCDKLGNSLTTNHTTSCGCKINRIGITSINKEEYTVWNNIKQWCNNKNNPKYKYYGEKGISICKQWESSFETFLNDVGNKPKNSIFCRKNEFGNFTKENCYWKVI